MPNINHINYTEETSHIGIKKQRHNEDLFKKVTRKKDTIVVLRVNGIASHVGYMLDENHFIHVLKKRNVTIEQLDGLLWKNAVVGFYEYKGKEKSIDV